MKRHPEPIMVTRPYLPPKEEFLEIADEIWMSHWLTNNGNLHNRFEKALADYLNVDNVSLLVNGHLALEAAIDCLDLKGEIITTPYTFVSTTNSIVRRGCTPVFCDIKKSDLTMDETKIERFINENTCAIMPVHVYGHPCNVEEIHRIAGKHGLKVIYDAAHAFGDKVGEKGIAEFGTISMFSFHATKLFHSIEGGALAYSDTDYHDRINHIKNFGIVDEEHAVYIGGNAKMNEFQAAMGLANLKYIDEIIEERARISNLYRELLKEVDGIRCFYVDSDPTIRYNYAYFPILIDETELGISRDRLYDRLKEYNIFSRKYFYPLTSDFECYRDLTKYDTPVARKASNSVLTLPIYNGLSLDSVNYIVDCIKEIAEKSR